MNRRCGRLETGPKSSWEEKNLKFGACQTMTHPRTWYHGANNQLPHRTDTGIVTTASDASKNGVRTTQVYHKRAAIHLRYIENGVSQREQHAIIGALHRGRDNDAASAIGGRDGNEHTICAQRLDGRTCVTCARGGVRRGRGGARGAG